MSPRAPSLAAALSSLCAAGAAEATKRRFEPTDLELEEAGTLQADIQFGPVRSDGPLRLVLPDAEIDLGLAPNIELDVDFTFGLEGPAQGPYRPDHGVTDNTWIAAKTGADCAVNAAHALRKGERGTFALTRPPGVPDPALWGPR